LTIKHPNVCVVANPHPGMVSSIQLQFHECVYDIMFKSLILNPARHPRHAWVMAVLLLVMVTILLSIVFNFGFFFKAIAAEFELSRAVTSLIVSINIIVGGGTALVAGRVLDRYGPRRVILAMGLLTGASLVLVNLVEQPWQLLLMYGLLLGVGTGPVVLVPSVVLTRWFNRYRATAYGIALSGTALATLIGAPIMSYLVTNLEWRLTYVIVGAFAGGITVLIALFFGKAPPPDAAAPPSTHDHDGSGFQSLARQPSFWYILGVWTIMGYSIFFVFSHLVPHTTDSGFSAIQAVGVLSTMGFASLAGRLPAGVLADMIGRQRLGFISAVLLALAMLLLTWISQLWAFYVFAAVFGFAYSSFSTSMGSLVGDVFGAARIGTVFGIFELGLGIGAALGAFVSGAIFDAYDSYFAAFLIAAVTWIAASILTALIRKQPV
jgi:MFS family permease